MLRFIMVLVFAFGIIIPSKAQHEIGINLGTSNLLSDYGGGSGSGSLFTRDINVAAFRFAAGGFYRYNFKRFFAIRAQLLYGGLHGSDDYTTNPFRNRRGLTVSGPVLDFTTQFEFNFIPLHLCASKNQFTPYIAVGIGGLYNNPNISHRSGGNPFNPDEIDNYNEDHTFLSREKQNLALNIPVSFGLKYKLKQAIMLGLEVSHRFTLSDHLDQYIRQQNDQYFFITANVSYVFCHAKNSKNGYLGCPSY